MKILVVLFARLGDICCAIPPALELRRKYPDAKIYWLTLEEYFPLIPPGFIRCKLPTPGEFGRMPDFLDAFDLVLPIQPMWRHDEWRQSGLHVMELIAKWCGVELRNRRIVVDLAGEPIRRASRFVLPERFLAIGCSPPVSSRNVFDGIIPEVVEFCRDRKIPIVTVGGKEGRTIEGAISLHGFLSPLETVAVLERATMYVGPDTGTTWLACAAQRPRKICVLDEERFKDGVVGFGTVHVESAGSIDDIAAQAGGGEVCHLIDMHWPKG